jgi:hypothetical protein
MTTGPVTITEHWSLEALEEAHEGLTENRGRVDAKEANLIIKKALGAIKALLSRVRELEQKLRASQELPHRQASEILRRAQDQADAYTADVKAWAEQAIADTETEIEEMLASAKPSTVIGGLPEPKPSGDEAEDAEAFVAWKTVCEEYLQHRAEEKKAELKEQIERRQKALAKMEGVDPESIPA